MLGRTALSLIGTLLLSVVAAHAECFGKTAKSVMANPHEELVFVGTVVDVTRAGELGQRATFQVTRVWKGSVPERFDLYVWELTEGRPHFEKGQRHMGFAAMAKDRRVLHELGRESSKEPTFIATSCSELLSLSPTIERDLGRGYEPQRQTKLLHVQSAHRAGPADRWDCRCNYGGVPTDSELEPDQCVAAGDGRTPTIRGMTVADWRRKRAGLPFR